MVPLIETAVGLCALTLLRGVDLHVASRILGANITFLSGCLERLVDTIFCEFFYTDHLFYLAYVRHRYVSSGSDKRYASNISFFLLWWKAIWFFSDKLDWTSEQIMNIIFFWSDLIQLLLSLNEVFLLIRENCLLCWSGLLVCVFVFWLCFPLNSSLMPYYCITTHLQIFWGSCR